MDFLKPCFTQKSFTERASSAQRLSLCKVEGRALCPHRVELQTSWVRDVWREAGEVAETGFSFQNIFKSPLIQFPFLEATKEQRLELGLMSTFF